MANCTENHAQKVRDAVNNINVESQAFTNGRHVCASHAYEAGVQAMANRMDAFLHHLIHEILAGKPTLAQMTYAAAARQVDNIAEELTKDGVKIMAAVPKVV